MIRVSFLFAIIFGTHNSKAEKFSIGYLTGSQRRPGDKEYSRPGLTISGAISLAVDEINNGSFAKHNHTLDFIVAETYGEEIISVQKTAQLWTKNISAYIGPQETCEHEAFMAAAFNVPMISYFCAHYATSEKQKFPTFARTRPPDIQISKAVASILRTFNWTHVVLLYLKDSEYEFENVAESLQKLLQNLNIHIESVKFWTTPYHHGYMENPFIYLLEETYKTTRIYVVLGHHYEHLGLVVAMEEKGLFTNGEYFVLGVDIEQYDSKNPVKYLRGLLKDADLPTDPTIQKAFKNYLGVVPSSPVGFENFTLLVNSYMEKPPFNFPNPLSYFGKGKLIRAEAAYLYDAVHLYAKGLLTAMANGHNPRNGTAVIDAIKNTHYKSAMGYIVYMNENGDAEGNYSLIARNKFKGDHRHEYGLYPVGIFALPRTSSKLPILHLTDALDWVNGEPPSAIPTCGFTGEYCVNYTIEITSGVAGGTVLILIVIFLILYRNWKYEQELDSLLWKVDYRDIQIKEDAINRCNTRTKIGNGSHPPLKTSQASLSSNPEGDFRYSTIYTKIGLFKGRIVALKKVYKKSIDITREMKKELKLMRDLRHDNLNPFVGVSTEPPNIFIITEYCSRGSLRDILENEDVKLDNMFIASLVGDIINGMIYLHESPIHFHGMLHTGNCLVDSRWVLKLSDFGLVEFKKGTNDHYLKDLNKIKEKCINLLYRAPEVLRKNKTLFPISADDGSPKGDVYSFSIILYEFYSRHGPFGTTDFSPGQIISKVMNSTDTLFRPSLSNLDNCPDFVKDCLRECWTETPDDRPDFKSIRLKLRPLRKGMKQNILDNMMAMMEKYANNLEVLVDERTDQLQEEKKKTELLLHEMLPRPVAEQLKRGNKVEAESFDCVTIYFSDVVGFTEMSAQSTPLEVVNFLNDLYTCFDSIIGSYDVYKVETIGDAYMVVSGLPIRNENYHASEIASMSLHLLSQVKTFTIKHRPKEKLKLRIGIHSGPVCAGVVGLKMPRYCLFGDTVNTASRMESTGLPLRIHCSKACRDLLINIGGYQFMERGMVDIKGKGNQQTFWLISEDPQMRNLRELIRKKRRAELHGKFVKTVSDSNGCFLLTRSSLKTKCSFPKSPLMRCSSFEMSKRLRFATDEDKPQENFGKIMLQESPKNGELLIVPYEDIKQTSASCPCIEDLPENQNSEQQLLFLGHAQGKATCHSVPTLFCHLSVPYQFPLHAISAPTSPNINENKNTETEILWAESTPLLKISMPEDVEGTVLTHI